MLKGPDGIIKGAQCTRERFSSRGIDPQSLTLTLQEFKGDDIDVMLSKFGFVCIVVVCFVCKGD